uniref:BZIP domain-containing protein n=1 Tax=Glossina brevipalpis TaxID=37001 RepID=A0A1A9W4D4_9MUSC
MHDWFLERDVKDATVILNDKLISDALLNGTLPIKSEHSYSLNSDGDSLPDSPGSLHTKMDGLSGATIDPKYLNISTSSSITTNSLPNNNALTGFNLQSIMSSAACNATSTLTSTANSMSSANGCQASTSLYAGLCKTATNPTTLGLRGCLDNLQNSADAKLSINKQPALQLQQQQRQLQQHQYLPQDELSSLMENDCGSSISSREGSQSPDICSDIEIDESCIKNEPLSPASSCSPTPEIADGQIKNNTNGTLSLTMANMAAFTDSDLVFEHKNGCLQLTPSSQSLLKSQQIIISSSNAQNVILPKFTIKAESTVTNAGTFVTTATSPNNSTKANNTYGLPLTPPSSLSSDGSEGNLTPEHMLSPQSPTATNTSATTTINRTTAAVTQTMSSGVLTVTAIRRGTSSSASSTTSNSSNSLNNMGRHNNGGSTRQPIHTPLISSQPKGSTGTLILTEEEKRTLLAEGYPIPQKLPLTKAEEKSLKKIRRKIKNKISAQESRRKKKEYMDQLERKVEILVNENNDYKKRVQTLEDSNASLLSQLHKLQALVSKQNLKKT